MRPRALLPLAWLLLSPLPARALTQPDGTVIPTAPGCDKGQPTGLLATFACVCTQPGICNIGAPCSSPGSCDDGKKGECESTMWHAFNDNTCIPSQSSGLDPVAEASTKPETFRPTCALTFTLVTRGTAQFRNLFGWYNATGKTPAPSELHPMFGCNDPDGTKVVLDLSKEPAYAGGDIGFFLMTPEAHDGSKQCAAGNCCPTVERLAKGEGYAYFSERQFNPDSKGADSYIHLLVYNSRLSLTKFYFAWEDLFGGGDNQFTDVVTSVEGVQCSGGGEACATGKKGLCAQGITACQQGSLVCTDIFAPKGESCDGVDEDCDGVIDNDAVCPPKQVCQNGRCVPSCQQNEFPCAAGTECDKATGRCLRLECVDKSCPADQVCRAGSCGVPCEGVTCPRGQTCVSDACVDLCAGVSCAPGQVCREGVCLSGCSSCDGVSCAKGLACDPKTNDCADPSCSAPCPEGTFCKAGACVDACDGVACPPGQSCAKGSCSAEGAAGAGGISVGGQGGTGGQGGAGKGGAGGAGGAGAGGTPTTPADPPSANAPGCSCRAAPEDARWPLASALGLAALLGARRRRPRR
jgi:MYXO-CTERM domain-containing protein